MLSFKQYFSEQSGGDRAKKLIAKAVMPSKAVHVSALTPKIKVQGTLSSSQNPFVKPASGLVQINR